MKNIFFLLIVLFAYAKAEAQSAPEWVRDINSSPDPAAVIPVRTLNDDSNHVFVLCTYMKNLSPGVDDYKIYLKKYNDTGGLIWSLIYDHGGIGKPNGYDMVMDPSGNCYIAGGLMANVYYQPLLIKVNASGSVVWERDSTTTFHTTNYDQVFFKNNMLYVKAASGIAKFDLNGIEQWSNGIPAGRMAVDNAGQAIVSVYFGNPINILRFSSSGVINFSDTTINTKRIAVDADNNFYLLEDNYPTYHLVKYDSAGVFAWRKDSFTSSAAFGDIGFDVLVDYNKDVILVGLNDTMYKFSPSGNLIWNKPMNGLDSYLLSAKIAYNNLIVVAGSIPDATGYNLKVATFDLLGNENWSGEYNSNPVQEYGVDLTNDNSGVYAIEDNQANTTLAKFSSPFQTAIDYNLICVDSVWYDPVNPNYVNIRIFNGNVSHLNYPSVQAISLTGDTINPLNDVSFFAHLGNRYQTYQYPIPVLGITDFRNYTFLISEGFGDTTVVINWCAPLGIIPVAENEVKIYPNPVHDALIIENTADRNLKYTIQIFSTIGAMIIEKKLPGERITTINVSNFAYGIYFLKITDGNKVVFLKFVKQ